MKSAAESKLFSTNKTLNVHGRLIDLGRPQVMGILNITPDSFYGGSRFNTDTEILDNAERMIRDGATFIDVGGYSTRPGATEISVEEELSRVVRAIRLILKSFPETVISIDTFRSAVASAAVKEGAGLINDVSGGSLDPLMFQTAASLKVPYILMHMRGTPQTMMQLATYDNLAKDITDYFHQKIFQLEQVGVTDVIIDPGFGFAKTVQQNFELLRQLDYFKILNKPLLAGLSRKSMVWRTLSISPDEALNGTSALHAVALLKGVDILRVHDVKEACQVIRLMQAVTTTENIR